MHPPRGSGVRISTVTTRSSSSLSWGTPVFWGWVSHETAAVSASSAPSSRVNVNTSSAGDAPSVSPSAGETLLSEFTTSSWAAAVSGAATRERDGRSTSEQQPRRNIGSDLHRRPR